MGIGTEMVRRLDGWMNSVTGLGTSRDKTQATEFQRRGRTDDATLDALYDEDDMASRVCDAPPEHMLRRSFEVLVEGDSSLGPAVVKYLQNREAVQRVTDALVWERVYGGGVVVIGADDGEDVSQPLDEERINTLAFLNALDRRDVVPQYWYSDPTSLHYGRPSVYRITYLVNGMEAPINGVFQTKYKPHNMLVHESRLLTFRGARTSGRNRQQYGGWGTPTLSRIREPLQRFNDNWASVSHMMADGSQGVYGLKGLIDIIASGKQALLDTRFELIDKSRSVARAILIDADGETFERKDTSMSGLPELLDRTSTRLAAAARMPVTVLLGISPAGLNATGESDVRNWYDTLESERTQKVLPQIERLVRMVFLAKDGPTNGVLPDKWEVRFPSLWQETDQEKAATSAARTQSDVALIQAGVVTPEEVAIRRAEELEIDTDSREKQLERDALTLALPPGGDTTGETTAPAVAEATAAPATTTSAPDTAASPKTSLTGVQITSLLEVLAAISERRIPRNVGVRVIMVAFALEQVEADKLIGEMGTTFFAPVEGENTPPADTETPAAPAPVEPVA